MIQNLSTCHIQVRGEVNEDTFNRKSPLQIKVVQADLDKTFFAIDADQSGLIGLIRYLHGQGYALMSVHRIEKESAPSKEELSHDRNNI